MVRNILLLALAAASAQAVAQDISIVVVPVHASDRAHPAALNARIKGAIDRGCGILSAHPYEQWTDISRCRRTARNDVDRQLQRLPNLEGQGIELSFAR